MLSRICDPGVKTTFRKYMGFVHTGSEIMVQILVMVPMNHLFSFGAGNHVGQFPLGLLASCYRALGRVGL